MTKKYGKIDLSIDEFYSYVGNIIIFNNKMLSYMPIQNFDGYIKGIELKMNGGRSRKISNPPVVIDLLDINHTFSKRTIEYTAKSISLFFASEETALYFKLKYCS